jgi:ABC-type antimicrobial peptide transport system permease subunit
MVLVLAGAAGARGAGVVLALGLISARRRAYDYASLRVVGVHERALRRAAAGELAAAVLIGLLVGVGSGLGGTALATHALPLFVRADVGLPTVSSVPWLPVVALCCGLVAVLAAVCVAVVAVVRRNAGVARLREGAR